MYAPFFGLSQPPFSIAPDPHMLFMSKRHREALAHLLYGVGGRHGNTAGAGGGFVLLTGEIGTGKTTVCRCFLEQIPASCNVAYIVNPKLTVLELLQSICHEFHIPPARYKVLPTIKDYLDPLNAFLLRTHAEGRNNVLIIDEAQNLSSDVLEQLRLLTNLETSERKLLQIVLIGQPKLRAKLQRPELEQLAQRVIARYHLEALTEVETVQYIQHRLEVAGLKSGQPFERRAVQRIHRITRGVPRRINLLCDRSLLGAFATGKTSVDSTIVNAAAGEVFDPAPTAKTRASVWQSIRGWVWAVGGVAFGAVLVSVLRPGSPVGPTTSLAPRTASPAPAAAPAAAASGALTAASAPKAPASQPQASAPPPVRPPPALLRDENQAWRELARLWKAGPGEAGSCESLAREQLRCFSTRATLALVRQLGRPGIVTLDSRTGSQSYALLTSLTPDSATLRAGDSEQTVTLAALAARWDGEFSTLWRSPQGYTGRLAEGEGGPVVQWISDALSRVDGSAPVAGRAVHNAAFKERLRKFQLVEGLPADGVWGPVTGMLLNRKAGVEEPSLASGS